MLKFFSRNKTPDEQPDYSVLNTDMHSHLIPGIDDGSPDPDTSVSLIKGMMEQGYKRFIATPHIMWDMRRNTRDIILRQRDVLRDSLKEAGMDVQVDAAAEYFLDDYVEGLLEKNEPLLTISGSMVLVEFSMAQPSMSLKKILFDMQMQGYQPVIAHPERYVYLDKQKDFYDELKNDGCYFQLNLMSLGGYYGKTVQELAQYLLKKGYYDLAGTDLHNIRHLDALRNPQITAGLAKLVGQGHLLNTKL
ncbi:MAG: hypothetical protein IPP93_06320 [Chitinophagaceae bacterium]|nr:hypothetical protein [Chitinophagaceae bacterium]